MTDKLELKYMPLTEARLWSDNQKKHDIGALVRSIKRYGFKDPAKWEPELNGGRGGIVEGNGRFEALAMMKDDGEPCPEGVLSKDGEWHVPVLYGVDAESESEAEAYGIDHNTITVLGGDVGLPDIAKMWDEGFGDQLERLGEDLQTPVSLDLEDADFFQGEQEPEELESEGIDRNKELSEIKILNLYAGIGGNRKFWGDLDVTAVEWNEEIAKVYQHFFPNDTVIVDDAHEYLEKHFEEYDFIWSSPPCPTHSRMRKNLAVETGQARPVYPDMRLYEEILFLQGYHEGKWVVENVKSWYDPLIEPQERGRHYFWANFDICRVDLSAETGNILKWQEEDHQDRFGFDLDGFNFPADYDKGKVLRNMVHPKLGEQILKSAYLNTGEE